MLKKKITNSFSEMLSKGLLLPSPQPISPLLLSKQLEAASYRIQINF